MAEQSGFFADVDGDRAYTDTFLAQWIASIISNGVYNGELGVTAGDHMQVIIPAGRAWINGYHYRNDSNLVLAIANADGVLHRKDIIVLRWDVNNRSITAQVIQGTPASDPIAPSIVRSAEQYDLKLAEISIPAGTTVITQDLITDTRMNSAVCGFVHGVVQQVDTSTLFAQYQAWYTQITGQAETDIGTIKQQFQTDITAFKNSGETDFNTWLDGIKDILNADTAGNLLNLINTHEDDNTLHVPHLGTTTNSGNAYSITSTNVITENSKFSVKFNAAATGTATLNISSDGTSRTLTKPGGGDFKPKAGVYTFIRDGANFQCVGEGGEYGTATAADVLAGETLGTEDGVVTGTMPNNGPASAETINLTTQNQEYTIAAGWHSGLRKIKALISGLAAAVIKAGSTVGGIAGTFTADATATKSNILSQKTAYVNGNKITGDMPNQGAVTITPSTVSQAIPAGYHNGNGYVVGSANLVPENIKNGINIFGKVGTLIPLTTERKWASGTVTPGMDNVVSVSGLGFTPSIIILNYYNLSSRDEYRKVHFSGHDLDKVTFHWDESEDAVAISIGQPWTIGTDSFSTMVYDTAAHPVDWIAFE